MRIRNNFKGTRGFLSTYESTIRWKSMRNKKEVTRRVKILEFFKEHGERATKDAFGVSRRTLYRWKSVLKNSRGKLPSLDPKSTAPHKKRRRVYPSGYIEKVINLRKEHPHIGKKKIAILCSVSESYAGRTLTDLKKRGLLPQQVKLSAYAKTGRLIEKKIIKRVKQRRKSKKGMEVDTIVRFINGVKRYVYTAIDVQRRFAFAGAYTSHSSTSATDFLDKLITVTPFVVREIQTDNGSEFAKYFSQACRNKNIVQYHIYPRTPKMNAHVERFNRTLSEDFISLNRMLLSLDIKRFNDKLIDWLLWYNTERPHQSLGMLSPLAYTVRNLTAKECQMWWTSTIR